MKICQKCGKELMDEAVMCPGCGCAVETKKAEVPKESYEQAIAKASTTNIIGIVLLAVGVLCAFFIHAWAGVVLCLVAEIVCLLPNSKVQKLFKQNNVGVTDKKKFKADAKALTKELKSKNSAYKFSFIISYISLACLIVFALLANAMGL